MGMQGIDQLDSILRAVEELGLIQAPRRVPALIGKHAGALEGTVAIEGRVVTLHLALDSSFPLRLPRFFLRPWDALGFIPHVDQTGFICFLDPEGLILDRRRPVHIVQGAFERAIQTLTDGVTEKDRWDFVDEFEVHWARLSGGLSVISVLDPSDEVGLIQIAFNNEKPLCVAHGRREISAFNNGAPSNEAWRMQQAIYLPLEPNTFVRPPRPDGPFWTEDDVRQVVFSGLSEANRLRLEKLIKKRPQHREYIIVKLPRPSGGETLFGIQYDGVGKQHPLVTASIAKRMAPIRLQRWDRRYLTQRGGGDPGLSTKRVLLAGCGALGGHLAFELARAGILNLTLIDSDTLQPENTFRHCLGRRHWTKPKSEALKEEILAELPYIQVTAIVNNIENALADRSVKLDNYDLVILALGNPTVELEINARIYTLVHRPAAIFTWLEPFGIGGHALLTRNGSHGCFECLYTSPIEEDAPLQNRAAFADAGQRFGRALSGCGSLHTPYGSVDAIQTAALAARLAVDTLTGKEKGNPLLSWKGDASSFKAAGFRLSQRYNATEEELNRHRYAYQITRCQVCGRRGKDNP